MELTDKSPASFNHGFTLLRELNSQRGLGQFCDCVIQLQVQPRRLFLAHKSVLAAFSPVLASLLPWHGALVDLNLPYLSPETLDILLDYIYTGTLPPQSQEEPVLSAATHLQMEQLQQALRWRRKALAEATCVQDKPNRKRRFVEAQSANETLSSPSYYPYGSDQPVSSSPSCEVVPVICHVRTAGSKESKFPPQVRNTVKHSKEPSLHGNLQPAQEVEGTSLLDQLIEPAQSKQDKFVAARLESSRNDLSGVFAGKIGSQSRSSSDGGEPQSMLPEEIPQTIAGLRSKKDIKDWNAPQRPDKGLYPETKGCQNQIHGCLQFSRCDSSGDSKCLSDAESTQSINPFDSRKGEHLAELLSDTLSQGNSCNSSGNPLEDGSRFCGQFAPEDCPKSQALLCLENSDNADANKVNCERRTSDPDVWHVIGQPYDAQKNFHEGKPLEIPTTEREPQRTDFREICEFSPTRTYQGHLRYQCLLEHQHARVDSSDSDSDRGCLVLDTEVKESSRVLGTTDITEISLPTRRLSTSSEEHSMTHPFQCSMCERAFSQRGSLNRHMRSHLGVRPYACPQCSMTFSRQYRVTEHMRVHQRSCEDPSEVRMRTASTGMGV